MILLKILLDDRSEAEKAIRVLLDKNLIFDAFLYPAEHFSQTADKIKGDPKFMVEARTRALLFERLQQEIRQMYPDKRPPLFAVPKVYMDSEQTKNLKKKTMKSETLD
ncbi:hypothetical protein [Poritiphilus flavus]|uniref:Uncharacterized protein n=1 Tax=Poritiphilus flavus TaxID=2697053 RepID=A0A6L9EDB0_9FLAO|nr:hypothetical protein [Poritiphilus flavus]NAS12677.1 hypothetical protein [Poritiphilus flavus]